MRTSHHGLSRDIRPACLAVLVMAFVTCMQTGCSSPARVEGDASLSMGDPRALPMFVGRTSDNRSAHGLAPSPALGSSIDWTTLRAMCAAVDVVIMGELHDDAQGHAVQRALVEDLAEHHPTFALSMEMLERDDQVLVQDYVEGLIDAPTFEKLTHSTSWGGEGKWAQWYQPIVDAAHNQGGAIVAANAPRRYVRLARLRGYEFLETLDAQRRALFALPAVDDHGSYRTRFRDLMAPPPPVPTATATTTPGHEPAHTEQAADHEPDNVDKTFRSQLVWDATMADSIARALREGRRPIVHLVGQFHSDFDGGTVQELRQRAPDAKILVISMQRRNDMCLQPDDVDRADVIIHTGVRAEEAE